MTLFGITLRKPSFNEVTAATIMAGRQDCAREELGTDYQDPRNASDPAGNTGRGFSLYG